MAETALRMYADQLAVETWLRTHNVSYNYKTQELLWDGKTIDFETLHNLAVVGVKVEYERGDGSVSTRDVKPQKLDASLALWINRREQQTVADTREALLMAEEGDPVELLRFVTALTGRYGTEARFLQDVLVFRHFIWQVKRKLAGLPVTYHMMPVLVGKTGGGKSVAIRRLLEPVAQLTTDVGLLDELGDPRSARLCNRFYVLFCDEMARTNRASAEALKARITADVITYRVLGSHRFTTVPMNATLIGAANIPVADIVYDPTSARRFWQVDVQDMLDWDAVNEVNMAAIWGSVNHEGPAPIIPLLGRIQETQHVEQRAKDLVEEFVDECVRPLEGEKVTPAQAYDYFVSWCNYAKIKPWSPAKFKTRFGGLVTKARSHGVRYYVDIALKLPWTED